MSSMTPRKEWVVRVSAHAISRYRERVEPVSYDEAHARLTSPAILKAAEIGCAHVKLPGGQRVVIHDRCVITVTPRQRILHRRTGRRFIEVDE